jgi:MFS family permease
VINSSVSCFTNPIFNNFIGFFCARERWQEVHKNIGAINASVLAIAPVVGGWLASVYGSSLLYLLNSLGFLIAAVILLPLFKQESKKPKGSFHSDDNPSASSLFDFQSAPKALRSVLLVFIGSLILGGVFNGLEFAVFKHYSFDKEAIGFILGAWGLGNLFTIFVPIQKFDRLGVGLMSALLSFVFMYFCWNSHLFLAVTLFVLAGAVNAVLTGKLRGLIQHSIQDDMSSISVWSKLNKYVSVTNIGCYAVCGLSLHYLQFEKSRYLIILASLIFLMLVYRERSRLRNQCK